MINNIPAAGTALLNELAAIHLAYGNPGTARALLELSSWVGPDNTRTHALMARSCYRDGELDNARIHMDAARALDPQLPERDLKFIQMLRGKVPPTPNPAGLAKNIHRYQKEKTP